MSTIVCQNIVPYYESQITETTLKLKLSPPPPPLLPSPPAQSNTQSGKWDFLQSIPKLESSYTHPSAKKPSFSILNEKSLELCTENLGNESGSDIITGNTTTMFNFEFEKSNKEKKLTKSHVLETASSCRKIKNFPPPLTTMSGSNSLQVRRKRYGGRLIIEAMEAPVKNSYLQAERSDGRLRLCFLRDEEDNDCDDKHGGQMEDSEGVSEDEFEDEVNVQIMGIEKFERMQRSRCSENGGLGCNWEPALWVAT